MTQRIERDAAFGKAGGGESRAKIAAAEIIERLRVADLVRKDEIEIEPRAPHCDPVLELGGAMPGERAAKGIAQRDAAARFGGFGLIEIEPAAGASILNDLLNAGLGAGDIGPAEGEIFLGPHSGFQGEFEDEAVRGLAAGGDEPAGLFEAEDADRASGLGRQIGVIARVRANEPATAGIIEAGPKSRVEIADRGRGFADFEIDRLHVFKPDGLKLHRSEAVKGIASDRALVAIEGARGDLGLYRGQPEPEVCGERQA